MSKPALPSSVELLVPHRGRMSFLENLESIDPEAVATARSSGNLMTDISPEGQEFLNPLALAEMAAQTCAAWNGYRNLVSGETVKNGFLAGITCFDFTEPPKSGTRLSIHAREQTCIPPVTIVSARILSDGKVIASGDLKVWEQEGSQDFQSLGDIPVTGKTDPGSLTGEILAAASGFQSEGDHFSAEYTFPADFCGFSGHFPDFPILPGVIILRTAWLLAERGKGHPLSLTSIKRIKFGRPVLPGEKIVMSVTFRSPGSCGFEVTGSEGKASSGFLEFAL